MKRFDLNMKIIPLAILAVFVLFSGGCNQKPPSTTASSSGSQHQPAIQAEPFHGEVYRSLDGRNVLTLISKDECELAEGQTILLCKYTKQNDALRIVTTALGTSQVVYFRITDLGLQDNNGRILLSPKGIEAIALEKQRVAEAIINSKHETQTLGTYELSQLEYFTSGSHVSPTRLVVTDVSIKFSNDKVANFSDMTSIGEVHGSDYGRNWDHYNEFQIGWEPEGFEVIICKSEASASAVHYAIVNAYIAWKAKYPKAAHIKDIATPASLHPMQSSNTPASLMTTPPVPATEKSSASSNTDWNSLPFEEVKRGAEANDAAAQNSFGFLYDNGRGVPKDDAEAIKWYRKAAEQGNAAGQCNLGAMYENGRGVVKDDAEAVKWYRLSADQGVAVAQYSLGMMYANGQGVTKDDAEAVRWYRKAADQGVSVAQALLGSMYITGRGVLNDDAEAVKWYRKAAEQGLRSAQTTLGLLYEKGRGVTKDDAEAMKWYRKAANQGDATAKSNLARLEAAGSTPQARDWSKMTTDQVRVLADNGEVEAQRALGNRLYQTDSAGAMRWYRKAAEQGDARAQSNLGLMYANGVGIPKDYVEAARWYRKAADQGDETAKRNLATLEKAVGNSVAPVSTP